jgi:hypothetical protein
MGARPYDPSLGRFLAPDPVEGGSLNLYDYAGQDPVNGYDLDGLYPGWCMRYRRCRPSTEAYNPRSALGCAVLACGLGSRRYTYRRANRPGWCGAGFCGRLGFSLALVATDAVWLYCHYRRQEVCKRTAEAVSGGLAYGWSACWIRVRGVDR